MPWTILTHSIFFSAEKGMVFTCNTKHFTKPTVQFSCSYPTCFSWEMGGFHMQHQTLHKPYNSVQLNSVSLQLWEALGSSEPLWVAPGCSGLLWAAPGCSGLLWASMGCSGLLRAALGCARLLWPALTHKTYTHKSLHTQIQNTFIIKLQTKGNKKKIKNLHKNIHTFKYTNK